MIWWGRDLGEIQNEVSCFRWITRTSQIVKVRSSLGWVLLCRATSWKLAVSGRKLHENLVTCTLLYNYLLQSLGVFLNYSHCWRQVMGLDRPLAGQPGISCILISMDPLTPVPLSCCCVALQGCCMSEVVVAFLQTAPSGIFRAPWYAPRTPAFSKPPGGWGSSLTLHGINW